MTPDREKRISLAIVAFIILAQAVVLFYETTDSGWNHNDALNHYTMTRQMVDALERGDNPLDFWSPEISLGVPMVRTYQPLAHITVAAVYLALGKGVPLIHVMMWVRYLFTILLPLSCYAAMTLLDFPPLTAAAGALLLPMVADPGSGMLGMEIRSWMGIGLFPQLVATHLLLATIGLSYRAIRYGTNVTLAGVALGLTCLAHLMYGWMGAVTVCLIAVLAAGEAPPLTRLRRTAVIAGVSAALSLFQLVPLFTDAYLINRAKFELIAKYDSYGATKILGWLFTGQIMDHDRLPTLSVLSFCGIALLVWRRLQRRWTAAERMVVGGFVFWLLVFFGRPTWGRLLTLLGISKAFHLHRLIAIVQIFLLMLAAGALSAAWRYLSRRWTVAAAIVITAILLAPMVWEREQYISRHKRQGRETTMAVMAASREMDQTVALAMQRGGRVYAGMANTWGGLFTLGWTPMSALLVQRLVPAVTFAYNSSVFPADLMAHFDELNPLEYRLFNIRTVISPDIEGAPAFLTTAAQFGKFRLMDAPGAGYFGVVDVPGAARINRETVDDVNEPWLASSWMTNDQYVWLDFSGSAPKSLLEVRPGKLMPYLPAPANPAGKVTGERQTGQVYEADLDVARPAYALFRMSYHFCWKVYVDGRSQSTMMLTPGFIGTAVTPGRHHVLCRYEPGNGKLWMAAAGLGFTLLAIACERLRTTGRVQA
jgi:hypothetical protein